MTTGSGSSAGTGEFFLVDTKAPTTGTVADLPVKRLQYTAQELVGRYGAWEDIPDGEPQSAHCRILAQMCGRELEESPAEIACGGNCDACCVALAASVGRAARRAISRTDGLPEIAIDPEDSR